MGDSRITTGDISTIVTINEVEREGVVEVLLAYSPVVEVHGKQSLFRKPKSKIVAYICNFELHNDGEDDWFEDVPRRVHSNDVSGYHFDMNSLTDFLSVEGLYLANARFIYPATRITFLSDLTDKRTEGLHFGFADLYREKVVEAEVPFPYRVTTLPRSPVTNN